MGSRELIGVRSGCEVRRIDGEGFVLSGSWSEKVNFFKMGIWIVNCGEVIGRLKLCNLYYHRATFTFRILAEEFWLVF